FFSEYSAKAEFMLLGGRLALASGDYEKALSSFNEILELDPNNIDAHLGLTSAALSESDFITAHEELDQILALDPANGEALLVLSRLEKQAGDLEQEEEYLQQAIAGLPSTDIMTPLRYAVLVGLRDNLTKQGKSNEALIYQGIIAESLPDADQNTEEMQAAFELLQGGDFVNARQALEELLERAPGSEQIISMLAVIIAQEGKDEAASLKFEDIIDSETSSPIALQLFSLTELRLNKPEKVIELLSKDIDSSNDGRLNALYAVALASSGQLDESEKYFLKSIIWEPNNGRLYLPLVRLYNIQGKAKEALKTLQTAFEKAPEDSLIQRSLIAQHLTADNKAAADSLVAKIVVDFPESQESQLLVANFICRAVI
ncbi:MAG: tetratricopeptide repeat protein, partial [Proteobacteria bacterium]|nr:tetratricopeptide repeat protein [Pseudomonadota bacterium]